MRKSAASVGVIDMATVIYIPEHKQHLSAMRAVMAYCQREDKVWDEQSWQSLVSGIHCDGFNAVTEFEATKAAYHKLDGMNFYQYVQSFSPRETITPAQAHEIAKEFAEQAWPGHEVLVTTHCDAAHVHSHFVINSVSYENGKKLRQDPSTLKKLRQLSDEICQAHGMTVLKPYQSGGHNLSTREYRTAKKGESWKFRLMYHIGKAMEQSLSREDFIILMKRKGYEVNWTEGRKHITFTCPNGMKCRGSRLHHEKYAKENFENEFAIRQQLTAHPTGAADTTERRVAGDHSGDTLSTHRLGDPRRHPEARAAVAGACNGVPTGTVPDAQSAADQKRTGANDRTVRPTAEGSQRTDDELHTDLPQTGWERERTAFLRHLEDALGQSASHGVHSNRTETQSAKTVRHYGSGFGSGLGAGLRGLAVASQIIDDEEDPEEWRKCIEAEQNGSNLGAALGFAIGAVMALSEEQEEVNEYYVEEAIWQQTM